MNVNQNELFVNVSKLPQPLEEEELYQLFDKVKGGDIKAKQKIIEHNVRLVVYQVSNRFKTVEYDKKDLVSIGILGLIKAVNTFDTSKNIKFTSYASRCIDNEILMFLRKIKKNQIIDSFDKTITTDKDNNELTIGETVSDGTNIEEEYTDNETHKILRSLVNTLPERDKEIIMMYYGFNGRQYTQQEIADKFNYSRSYISRIILRACNILGNELESLGLIEKQHLIKGSIIKKGDSVKKVGNNKKQKSIIKLDCTDDKVERKRKMGKELQTIYQYFNKYSKEEIDLMLTKLTGEEKALISLRYGDDLNNPITSEKWDKCYNNKFYGSLIPRMKRLLAKPNNIHKPRDKKPKVDNNSSEIHFEKENVVKDNTVSTNQTLDIITETKKEKAITEVISVEDYEKILEMLRTPGFKKLMNEYSSTEVVVISLKLGYVDGKSFSANAIAQFLEIDPQEVNNITRKVLLSYKERINQMLDNVIQIATEESKTPKAKGLLK